MEHATVLFYLQLMPFFLFFIIRNVAWDSNEKIYIYFTILHWCHQLNIPKFIIVLFLFLNSIYMSIDKTSIYEEKKSIFISESSGVYRVFIHLADLISMIVFLSLLQEIR